MPCLLLAQMLKGVPSARSHMLYCVEFEFKTQTKQRNSVSCSGVLPGVSTFKPMKEALCEGRVITEALSGERGEGERRSKQQCRVRGCSAPCRSSRVEAVMLFLLNMCWFMLEQV